MKKIKLLSILLLVTTVSCESKEDVQGDINQLRIEKNNIQSEVNHLAKIKLLNQNEINLLDEKLKELHIYHSGRKPKYILKLNLKQSHFSFSIKEHMKDEMNAVDFELPVDEEFYHSVSVGTEIVDDFRVGSFLLRGSIGDWEMTVINKEIR